MEHRKTLLSFKGYPRRGLAAGGILFFIGFSVIIGFGIFLYILSLMQDGEEKIEKVLPDPAKIVKEWAELSGNRGGKVVYAQPPHMFILDLTTGLAKKVPGVITAGGPNRKRRGKTPRPSWAPDGKRFVYRYDGKVYVCDEEGNKTVIFNKLMDCSDETRWSWRREKGEDWLVGPSTDRNVILVKIADPQIVKIVYDGGDVEKHCEITGENYVVYDDGSVIYVTPAYSGSKGIKISWGQNCRPCASPDNHVAWLPDPHTKYLIYDAATGNSLGALEAPEGEELYRLNWSNHPDFAAHMFGSRGNDKMQVRRISTGGNVFIGYGWDPDLWVK